MENLLPNAMEWCLACVKTGVKFVDNRPPIEPGKPETRNYRLLFVRNDEPVGQWSDVVTATVQP